jgi:CHASE2 domain-containing sensor protein
MPTVTDRKTTGLSLTTKKLQISLLGVCALASGLLASNPPPWLESWEYRAQSILFEMRGPIEPPDNIVILAIDDDSLGQGANYKADPKTFAQLEPIQTWPWHRQAYAKAIERLMEAGAKAVAVDVLFTTPSAYGEADDRALQQTLARYGDRVILASQYANTENLQGHLLQYIEPIPSLIGDRQTTGFINLPIETDGQIHHSGQRFLQKLLRETDAAQLFATTPPPSFAMATLGAAQGSRSRAIAEPSRYIMFHGPDQTFPRIPFWNVLDTNSWQTSLANGEVFRDKIVLIGSTAPSQQDQQPAPFGNGWRYPSPLYGVEVQANALATLQTAEGLQDLLPALWLNGLWVGAIVGSSGLWIIFRKTPLQQIVALGIGLTLVGGLSVSLFGIAHRWVPMALPSIALGLGGGACILAELVRHQQQAQRLRATLKSHLTVPLVRAIVDQQDDLRDLLQERDQEVRGKTLGGRYEILRLIGRGGFGETYLAQDLQRPGQPECVVKQLTLQDAASQAPSSNHQRLFVQEAAALERLGRHDRIPQLLAYFEEMGEFYLVQELIQGMSLYHELAIDSRLSVGCVMHLLRDVLMVLEFVHGQNVIHRDIKPSNLMHRSQDGHWVLIDFGIAKQLNPMLAGQPQPTIGVGTKGYVPPEQALGHPNCTSDLYALGITAIEALTGKSVSDLLESGDHWSIAAPPLSRELTAFLQKLTHNNEKNRYSTAISALSALQQLPEMQDIVLSEASLKRFGKQSLANLPGNDEATLSGGEISAPTKIWEKSQLKQ